MKLYHGLFVEIEKIQLKARYHLQKIFNEHERLKSDLEFQKKELELCGKELKKRETENEFERRKLSEEIEKVCSFTFDILE